MKLRTKIVILSILCFILLVGAHPAFAKSYDCSIVLVGGNGSTTLVKLTDNSASPAFRNRWFEIKSEHKNYFLALALTAISQRTTVKVNLKSTAPYSKISSMYINN